MRRSASEGADGSASVPGKPFLAQLLATLEHQQHQRSDYVTSQHRATRRRSHSRDALWSSWETAVLHINAPCLFYLQQLFRTMLTPVRSAAFKPETEELIRQWRVDGAFREQLDDMQLCAALGPASPRRILQLAGHLLELKSLMIQAMPVELNVCMPSECDLATFPSLQHLQIDECDLSNIKNMHMMTSRLKQLRYYNHSLDKLSSLLDTSETSTSEDDQASNPQTAAPWSHLETLSIVNCGLCELDESALLLPAVESICLRQNELTSIQFLQASPALVKLDLSYNRINSMFDAKIMLKSIRVLNLAHNQLLSTSGLEKLYSLEVLNLSYNVISSMSEVAYLVSLPRLRSLMLRGNPIEWLRTYREDVMHLFLKQVTLDESPWSDQELDEYAFSPSNLKAKPEYYDHAMLTGVSLPELASLHDDPSVEKPVHPREWMHHHAQYVGGIIAALLLVGLAQTRVDLQWCSESANKAMSSRIVVGVVSLCVVILLMMSMSSLAVARLMQFINMDHLVGPMKAREERRGRLRHLSTQLSACLSTGATGGSSKESSADAAAATARKDSGAVDVLMSSLQMVNGA